MTQRFIFRNEFFGTVRAAVVDGEAVYAAADICRAIGISNNRQNIIQHVDACEVKGNIAFHNLRNPSGVTLMTAINEDGVYSILIGVTINRDCCKGMKKWLCSEVFPKMRKQCAASAEDCSDTLKIMAAQIRDEQEKSRRLRAMAYEMYRHLKMRRAAVCGGM